METIKKKLQNSGDSWGEYKKITQKYRTLVLNRNSSNAYRLYKQAAGEREAEGTAAAALDNPERPSTIHDIANTNYVLVLSPNAFLYGTQADVFSGEQLEKLRAYNKIAELKPLEIEVDANNLILGKDEAKIILKDAFEKIGEVTNIDDGTKARFSNNVAGKLARHQGLNVANFADDLGRLYEDAICFNTDSEIKKDGHKEHPNIEKFKDYLNSFTFNGTDYYIRFTVTIARAGKKGKGENILHSTSISEIAIYKKEKPSSASLPVIRRSNQRDELSFDDMLADSEEKVKPYVDEKVKKFFDDVDDLKTRADNSLNQNANQRTLGSTSWAAEGEAIIKLFDGADASTVFHLGFVFSCLTR